MEAIKANGFPCSNINKSENCTKKLIGHASDFNIKQNNLCQKPSFGSTSPINESFFKKSRNFVCKILDKLQRKIETGGFIIEFMVIDFCGLIIPRIVQAYHRNEKELGHPNIPAAKEETTREFLSGPPMFFIPFGLLLASKKIFGSAAQVKLDTLKKFRKVLGNSIKENPRKNSVKNFYGNLIETIYKNHLDKDTKNNIVEEFVNLHKANSKINIKKQRLKVSEMLISANKKIGNNKKIGTSMADSSKIKLDGLSKNIGDFVEDCHNYSTDKDISKIFSADGEKVFEKIHDYKEGIRKFVTTSAIIIMSAFLTYVPKFYTQYKEYPGTAGLNHDEQKTEGGKK